MGFLVWWSLSFKRVVMVCSAPDPRSTLQGWTRDAWLLEFHHCLPCSQFSKRVSCLETQTSDKYPRGICRWQTPVLYWSRSQRETTNYPPSPPPRSSFIRGVKQKHLRSDHSLPQITNDLMDHSLFPTFYTFPCCGRRFRAIKPFPVPDVMEQKKSNPVGSTVRYEVMKLCTGSI